LFIFGEIIEFFSGVGLSEGFFISTEDADLFADSDGSVLKVRCYFCSYSHFLGTFKSKLGIEKVER